MCAWGPVLGCRQEGVIRLPEVLEILYQDGGNQITQLFQRALKSRKHLVGGWESLPLASTFHPCPLLPAPTWLFSEDPLPHAERPNLGAQHPSRSQSSFPLPPSSVRRETQAPAALGVHPSAREEKGEERGEAGGGRRSLSAARSAGGDRGGGAPFPPRADCCGVLPIPARVCEGARARWVGPMGVIEGFGDAEWRFPLPSE